MEVKKCALQESNFPENEIKYASRILLVIAASREVHIDMFDDRIEITSPGGMFGDGSIQEYDIYIIR